MRIKAVFLFIFFFLLVIISSSQVYARGVQTRVDSFRITTDPSQQNNPLIYGNLVVYTNFGGRGGIDIWGYNLRKRNNFPIIEKAGQQFVTGFYRDLVVYEDFVDEDNSYDVRLYNLRSGKDMLIAGGTGAQTNGVTNGRYIIYINGGVCGSLHAYDLRRGTTFEIINSTCSPVRIWRNTVVFPVADPNGTNIKGYDLRKKKIFDIATGKGFQETPNIYGNTVVWLHRFSGDYGGYNAIVMKNLRTGKEKVIYESSTNTLNGPAISRRYIVWSESSGQNIGGVKGYSLIIKDVFEVQEQGNHQNSHTLLSIWRNQAVWMAWRTGNGDIYGSKFRFGPNYTP